mmetsp:Transcript_112776/g.364211  ORF Transcript_112776/g.364211 Transcript_112776/m.364211 type:complete len:407 (-) Transcript_112776:8-1228(-)
MDPLLDVSMLGRSMKARKRALRIMFQRMAAQEMLRYFFDLHQMDIADEQLASMLSPAEYLEIVHNEVVCRLIQLSLACRLTLAPQKWIGSSVALGFDCGRVPARSQPEEEIRRSVRVNIFDWGRSELNTMERHMDLTVAEQQDRAQFWGYYADGIDRLLHGTLCAYWGRYGSTAKWKQVEVYVYDFDSMTDNDFIGKVTLPLAPASETTVVLLDGNNQEVSGYWNRSPSTLTYRITYRPHPEGSRVRGSWRLHLVGAGNLPALDTLKCSSDPFVVVEAVAEDGRRFRQQSSVILGNLNPRWGETIDIADVSRASLLEDAMITAGSKFNDTVASYLVCGSLGQLCCPCFAGKGEKGLAFRNLVSRLDIAAASATGIRSVGSWAAAATAASSMGGSVHGRRPWHSAHM